MHRISILFLSLLLGIALLPVITGCGKTPDSGPPAGTAAPTPPPAVPLPEPPLPEPAAPKPVPPDEQGSALKVPFAAEGIVSGLQLKDGVVTLYRFEDTFSSAASLKNYKITGNTSFGIDEYGAQDTVADAALVTIQENPDKCILAETYDNDSLTISLGVTPTVKGYASFDIWPLRFWPTSGRVTLNLEETGKRSYSFPLAASDYKHAATKNYDGTTLSAAGGKPYFSSYMNHNIYESFSVIPSSEQRWWPVRFLFRPAYAAGSLDGSVCREIEDPDRKPITVNRVHISINQLETYIRALRFKALLGEAVSAPVALTGSRWLSVEWEGDAPQGTRIGIQVRAAADEAGLKAADWTGPEGGADPFFLAKGPIPAALATMNYIQIRLLLKAEHDAGFNTTPAVRSVTLTQAEGKSL